MRSGLFIAAAGIALAAFATALPTSSNHVLHEKRSGSSSWSQRDGVKPDGRIKLPVRIGLAERNLHQGDDILMQISSPDSTLYGKHWTAKQVRIPKTRGDMFG